MPAVPVAERRAARRRLARPGAASQAKSSVVRR
jgi:hypothetical protein